MSLVTSLLLAVSVIAPSTHSNAVSTVGADPDAAMTVQTEQMVQDTQETGFVPHGLALFSYIPTSSVGHGLFDLFLLQGDFVATNGEWSVKVVPRAKFKSFSDSDKMFFMLQEGYASYRAPDELAEVKAGKIYSRFGRFWDYGVYGPLVANNDLKLRPDLGIAVEGAPVVSNNVHIDYALQYFVADGQSLRLTAENGEIKVLQNARQTDIFVGRVAPTLHLDDTTEVAVGLSTKRFTAHHSSGATNPVTALALDISYDRSNAGVFVEVGNQSGLGVSMALKNVNYQANYSYDPFWYIWGGGMYKHERFTMRMNATGAFYRGDEARSQDVLIQPGLGYALTDNVELSAEGALWMSTNKAAQQEPTKGFREKALYFFALARI